MESNRQVPPNVLLVSVDQLAARWLEPPFAAAVPTPHLDALRSAGAWCTNAYTSNPVCAPARATMATGLTTRQHGVLTNGYALRPEIPTFMQALQAAGIRTGGFGKFHFRPQALESHPGYEPYGFDETAITEDQRVGPWLDWIRSEHPDHARAALATIPNADLPVLAEYGPAGEDLRPAVAAAREATDLQTELAGADMPAAYELPFPSALSQTEWITRNACAFLERTDRPWFAHVSYVQPHPPNCPPADCLDRVDEEAIPEPIPPTWPDDPDTPACFTDGDPARHTHLDGAAARTRRRYYAGDLVHLDEQLGTLCEAIDRERTIVLFTADHGELLFDHGFTGKGQKHYDGAIRVPLLAVGPGIAPGSRDAFVQLEDLAPTILDAMDVDRPSRTSPGRDVDDEPGHVHGRSLLSLFAGEVPEDWRDAAYVESFNNIYSADPIHWARTIRTDRYRYTRYPDGSGEQLFDLASDPSERRNLAGDQAVADVRGRLLERLLDRMILQDDPLTPRDLVQFGVP